MNAPTVTPSITGPTTLRLGIAGTSGTVARSYWRNLPYDQVDRVGPTRTGDGDIDLVSIPPNGSLLITVVCNDPLGGYSLPRSLLWSMVEPDTLAGALGRLWALTPSLTVNCGQFFSQESPENLMGETLSLPWTIFTYDRSSYDFSFEQVYWETTSVELATYALGCHRVEQALAAIHTHLDWQRLPFLDLNTHAVMVDPISSCVESTFLRHRTGEVVWRSCMSYSVTVEKRHPHFRPLAD